MSLRTRLESLERYRKANPMNGAENEYARVGARDTPVLRPAARCGGNAGNATRGRIYTNLKQHLIARLGSVETSVEPASAGQRSKCNRTPDIRGCAVDAGHVTP